MSRYWLWGSSELDSTQNISDNNTSSNYNSETNSTMTDNINSTQNPSSAIDIDSNIIASNSPTDKTNASTNASSTNINIETSSVTSEALSTTSTLLEEDSPTSSAIPIPKRASNNRRTYDDQKSKSSSLRSWWSSSASRSSPIPSNLPEKKGLQEIKEDAKPTNPSDRLLNMSLRNHSSSTNPTTAVDMTTVKAEMIERRVRKSGSTSSLSNLLEPNLGKRKRRTESHPAIPVEFTSADMIRQTSTQSAPDMSSDSKRDHVLVKEEARLSTSNASTSSRSSWWRFVGVMSKDDSGKEPGVVEINNNVHNDTNDNAQSIQKDNMNSISEEPEKAFSENVSNESTIVQHAVSEETTAKTESANEDSVTKKRSGETKRWSLFGTWSASTPDLTEQTTNEHYSRSFTEPSLAENLPSKSSSPTSSTSSSSDQNDSAQSSSSSTDSNSTTQPQMTEIGRKQKSPQRSTSYTKHALNPVVQTLPQTRSSWLQFFSSSVAKSAVRIDNGSDRKLIESSEMIEKKEQSLASPVRIDDQSSTQTKIIRETDERKSIDSSTTVRPPSPKAKPPNKVLPSFDELPQFNSHRRPDSFIQQTLHAINSYLFPPDKQPSGKLHKWLDEITRSSLDVKKIAIIGVHGWFPTKFVRTVIGEPTGTSPKFCDMMQKAVVNYLAQHNMYLPEDAITLIPLEGEGKIDARVDILYTNFVRNKVWREALRAADVVFVTTHSQGTPVSTMLLARLISTKYVQPKRQRIGMLAMAGVSHGPFPFLKNNLLVKYVEADAARELFEFMNSDSTVVKKYRAALKIIINAGVKMVYVASMDDQVVPLYSAVFTGINHPSILRAIYIDGPIYQADDFLTNLIVFAIRLRNHGISDHGLLVPLSEVVAGSLYCEGHSTLYEDLNVYNLCVRYLFETSTASPDKLKLQQFHAQHRINPHSLPWAMRGILEDKSILSSDTLSREIEKLRKQYEEWEPTSKLMKDVKFRLEPFVDNFFSKSKL